MVVPNHDLHNICTMIANRSEGRGLGALVRLHVLTTKLWTYDLAFSNLCDKI